MVLEDSDDDTVIEDLSEKRRKMNEEEEEARGKFEKWAQRFRSSFRGKGKKPTIESDSEVEVVDNVDSSPSTSKANVMPASSSSSSDIKDANLHVYAAKLEEIKVDDIIVKVN